MILINGKPISNKVILDGEDAYTIRIETDDQSIEIKIGSDTLNRKIMKTPRAVVAPSRSATTHSSDTYPRNRY